MKLRNTAEGDNLNPVECFLWFRLSGLAAIMDGITRLLVGSRGSHLSMKVALAMARHRGRKRR